MAIQAQVGLWRLVAVARFAGRYTGTSPMAHRSWFHQTTLYMPQTKLD